jgi:hypothetical protein
MALNFRNQSFIQTKFADLALGSVKTAVAQMAVPSYNNMQMMKQKT